MQTAIKGTEVKVNVHVEPIDGLHMADYDFTCRFYTYANKFVDLAKDELIQTDADNYVAVIDTALLSQGTLRLKLTAQLPDVDCADDFRQEVADVDTGVIIR